MYPAEHPVLFTHSQNPLEELCSILARGYLRLLLVREKEKVRPRGEDGKSFPHQVELN